MKQKKSIAKPGAGPGVRSEPCWADVLPWTHAWDMADLVPYKEEGKDWPATPAMRIDTVADRGANQLPLRRDTGIWGRNLGVLRIPGARCWGVTTSIWLGDRWYGRELRRSTCHSLNLDRA